MPWILSRLTEPNHSRPRGASRIRRAARALVVWSALAYPITLVATILALRYVGEHWWVTGAALYLPRLGFGAPLPLLTLCLLAFGLRRWLWTQAVSAALVLFPLMGFVPPGLSPAMKERPALRLLSFNVNQGYSGYDVVCERINALSPDVVLVQEALRDQEGLAVRLRSRYPHVQISTQFLIASRFRILETMDPARIPFHGRQRSPRFLRYLLETPSGPVAVYNVHPVSPRGALGAQSFRAAFHRLRTGEAFEGDAESNLEENMALRSLQIETVGRLVTRERYPVVVAGDLNLPHLSPFLHRDLGTLRDGFREAGSGFGYTFPANHRFLRLDRILASQTLVFTSFRVDCEGASDHLCVVADIERSR